MRAAGGVNMKSGSTPVPRTKINTRTRWIMLALVALLVPLAFIAQSGSAQKGRVRREENREAAERREKKEAAELRRKTEQTAAPGSDEEKLRLAAAARPKAFRQSGLSPEPLSAKADAFAVSRPLSEVAKNQRKAAAHGGRPRAHGARGRGEPPDPRRLAAGEGRGRRRNRARRGEGHGPSDEHPRAQHALAHRELRGLGAHREHRRGLRQPLAARHRRGRWPQPLRTAGQPARARLGQDGHAADRALQAEHALHAARRLVRRSPTRATPLSSTTSSPTAGC